MSGAPAVAAGGAGALPPLYARWMHELLGATVEAERPATCDRCAMVPADGQAAAGPSTIAFSPKTKCCTYLPELANFLVGGVLSEGDPGVAAGRATVEARIDARVGVSPLGLRRTKRYALLYRNGASGFGQAASLLCPHFLRDTGRCGIWRHRETTCATWFCKHERGETGKTFWMRLHAVLGAAEAAIAEHCVLEAGLDAHALAAVFPPPGKEASGALAAADLDDAPDPAADQAAWGTYFGREREFFVRCAEIASALSWEDVARLGGARLAVLTRLLRDARAALLSGAVPPRAGRRQLRVLYSEHDSALIVGYSNIDPLRVPRKVVDVLHRFDGRRTEEVLAEIERDHGLRLSPGLVRKLADFGIVAGSVAEPEAT